MQIVSLILGVLYVKHDYAERNGIILSLKMESNCCYLIHFHARSDHQTNDRLVRETRVITSPF